MKKRIESILGFVIDNGPTILTIGFAGYVIALAQTRSLDTDIVLQWILAILGLLAISELVERLRKIRHIEETSTKILQAVEARFSQRPSADVFFMKQLPPLASYLDKATDIRLSGVALQRTIRDNTSVLTQQVKDGARIKVIVVNPDGDAAQRIAADPSASFSLENLKANVQVTLQTLGWLTSLPNKKGDIKLRLTDEEPYFNVIAIDPEKESGVIFVELYPQRWVIGSRPRFELTTRRDEYWFKYYKEQFDALWESSQPLELPVSASNKARVETKA